MAHVLALFTTLIMNTFQAACPNSKQSSLHLQVAALSMFSYPDGKARACDDRDDGKKCMSETFYQFTGKSKETLVKNPGPV